MEHTPTPYHRNIKPATKYTTIWSGRNEHIAYMVTSGRDPERVEEDMDFIVRACNAHDDLVAALKLARETMFSPEGKAYEGIGKALIAVDAAIAKAAAVQ